MHASAIPYVQLANCWDEIKDTEAGQAVHLYPGMVDEFENTTPRRCGEAEEAEGVSAYLSVAQQARSGLRPRASIVADEGLIKERAQGGPCDVYKRPANLLPFAFIRVDPEQSCKLGYTNEEERLELYRQAKLRKYGPGLCPSLTEAAQRTHLPGAPLVRSEQANPDYKVLNAARRGQLAELKKIYAEAKTHANVRVSWSENPVGSTALLEAAHGAHLEVLDFLIKNGADVNARDVALTTPLMGAVRCASIECVTLLLNAGADPTLETMFGNNALNLAKDSVYNKQSGAEEILVLVENALRAQRHKVKLKKSSNKTNTAAR